MSSEALVERVIRAGWAGGDVDVLTETVSSDNVRGVFTLFNTTFTDIVLTELDPIFANAEGTMVAVYGEMHIRQVAEFLHVSAIGREADCGFTAIFGVEDGRINKMWVEMDFAALYAT